MAVKFGHIPERIFIKQLLDVFLEKSKRTNESSTYERYKRVCQQHLYPYFGNMTVRDVLLLPPTLEALQKQKAYTLSFSHRVFHNPVTNRSWTSSEQLRRIGW